MCCVRSVSVSGWALPWLPYSRLSPQRSIFDLLLLHHNIGLEEVFYWWELQGGDVHASLAAAGAFRAVPPLFLLPLCCLRAPNTNSSTQEQHKVGEEGPIEGLQQQQQQQQQPSLLRVEFLAAFSGCWGREDEFVDREDARRRRDGPSNNEEGRRREDTNKQQPLVYGCSCSAHTSAAAIAVCSSTREQQHQQKQQQQQLQQHQEGAPSQSAVSSGTGERGRTGQQAQPDDSTAAAAVAAPDTERSLETSAAAREAKAKAEAAATSTAAAAATPGDDAFFSTGFSQGRSWRDIRLWKEGDLNVVGQCMHHLRPSLTDCCYCCCC